MYDTCTCICVARSRASRARVFCAMVALETTMVPRAEVREDAQHLALAAQGCDTRFCMIRFIFRICLVFGRQFGVNQPVAQSLKRRPSV